MCLGLKNSIDKLLFVHTVSIHTVRRQDGEQRGQEDDEISNIARPKTGSSVSFGIKNKLLDVQNEADTRTLLCGSQNLQNLPHLLSM